MRYLLLKSKQIPLEFQAEPQKFKKYHKIKYSVKLKSLSCNDGGLILSTNKSRYFTVKQLLSFLKLLKPTLKLMNRTARAYLPIHVDTTITKKPKDIRMGRGKGAPSEKVFVIKSGQKILSVYGLTERRAALFGSTAAHKSTNLVKLDSYKW